MPSVAAGRAVVAVNEVAIYSNIVAVSINDFAAFVKNRVVVIKRCAVAINIVLGSINHLAVTFEAVAIAGKEWAVSLKKVSIVGNHDGIFAASEMDAGSGFQRAVRAWLIAGHR